MSVARSLTRASQASGVLAVGLACLVATGVAGQRVCRTVTSPHEHNETWPGPCGDILKPSSISASLLVTYIDNNIAWDPSRGEPNNPAEPKHLLLSPNPASNAYATITPEKFAFNLSLDDLSDAGRIVAMVVTDKPFPERGFAKGINYIWLDRPLGGPVRFVVVSPDGKDWVRTPVTDIGITTHGHGVNDPNDIIPAFSKASSKCAKHDGRRACFLDDLKIQELPYPLPPSFTLLQATMTWITLNGVCVCQGSGCH